MIHSSAARTAIATAILALIDAGAAGKIKARASSGGTLLATWTLETVSGTIAGAVLTGSNFPKEVNAVANGTIGWVEITDDADTIILSTANVGTGAEQASFSSLTTVNGAPVRINSFTYTVPAGT